jgi:hypothetical protein
MAVAILAAVWLFLRRGWKVGAAYVLFYILYWAVKEDRHSKWQRKAFALRAKLLPYAEQYANGQVTQQQLNDRCAVILSHDLFDDARHLDFVYEKLLDDAATNKRQYQAYLQSIAAFLTDRERAPRSALSRAIAVKLSASS